MKQKTGRKLLSFLLTLAMVVGLMPGMSMTALADDTTGAQITADMTNLTAGTYYISSDTTINGELQVSAGTVVINLNGHTLRQDSNNTTSVIYVSGGNLTVNNGTITGGDGGHDQRGGGFFVHDGNVTVNNVTISDNTASWGGGVYMRAGSFTMNNSHIDDNDSVTDGHNYHDGGGVYLDGGTFTMNGGSIKNNTVTEGKKNGLVMANSNAVVRLSGDAFIYDNKDNGEQENLWADSLFEGASQIYVTGELGLNAKLGIRSNLYQVFTKSENTDYNDPTKFVSDNSNYRVGKNDAGQLMLVESTTQLITAANVTAAYGDTDKSVSATTDGDGTISYAVKAGSEDYIDVNSSTGALTIKAVPADGKAYVTVTASATSNCGEATKDVTVTIGKATATIGHEDKSTTFSSDGISIPIEGMFTIPTGAGEPTYSVTNGTGEGSYENGKLTVTKCGTFTVTVNTAESSTHVAGNASATLTVNKQNAVPATITANNSTYDGTEKLLVTPAPTVERADILLNSSFLVSWKDSNVEVVWGTVPTADSYEVWATYCGTETFQNIQTIQGGNTAVISAFDGKPLDKKRCVKVYVIAKSGGVEIGRTLIGHAAGPKNRHTNVKKLKVKKRTYNLKVGKSAKIKVTTKKMKGGKSLLPKNHDPRLRYLSTNTNVATVSGKGKITAVGAGTCDVWVYAQNGRSQKVTVVVQ